MKHNTKIVDTTKIKKDEMRLYYHQIICHYAFFLPVLLGILSLYNQLGWNLYCQEGHHSGKPKKLNHRMLVRLEKVYRTSCYFHI